MHSSALRFELEVLGPYPWLVSVPKGKSTSVLGKMGKEVCLMEGCPAGANSQKERERMRGVGMDKRTHVRAFLCSIFGEKNRRNMG